MFYHLGFGVGKNIEKSIQFLEKSAKGGNGQSQYQLYMIYNSEEGFKDIKKAYAYLIKAIQNGVSCFNDLSVVFKEN